MRVATYTQPTAVTHSSLAALLVLVMTIFLGSSAVPRLTEFFQPNAAGLVTLLWLATYCAAMLGLMLTQGINWISWLVRYRILLVVLMLGTILSITWAFDVRLSLERTVHLVGSTLVAIYIGFTVPLLKTLRVLAVVLGILLLASVGAALFMPDLGIESYEGSQVWSGILNSKNALGFWSAVGVLLYISLSDSVRTSSARLLCYLMAALSLVALVFSQSATSLLVMIVAGALSLYMFVAARFKLGFARMVVLALLMVGIVVMIGSNISTAELVGRSDDLTGRGEVWRQTWNLIMERPATGYGYGVLWFPTPDTSWIQETLTDFTWTVFHAHNGFLQVASEIGLPLAVIALLWVVQQLIEILYCQYQRQQVGVLFVLAFSVTYLLSNFSEARFLVNRELFWILFVALPISMLRQINLVAPTPEEQDPRAERAAQRPGMWETAAANLADVAPGGATAAGMAAAGLSAGAAQPRAAAAPPLPANLTAPPADDDADDWTEEDMNATLDGLTMSDADIDLGLSAGAPAANDDDAVDVPAASSAAGDYGDQADPAGPPTEQDAVMLNALDELFATEAPAASSAMPQAERMQDVTGNTESTDHFADDLVQLFSQQDKKANASENEDPFEKTLSDDTSELSQASRKPDDTDTDAGPDDDDEQRSGAAGS